MKNQISCLPNTSNAGNYYSFPAATAGGGKKTTGWEENSVCPKGWILSTNEYNPTTQMDKSFSNLISFYYNQKGGNSAITSIANNPLSFVFAGKYYNSSVIQREATGNFVSSKNGENGWIHSFRFTFQYNDFNPKYQAYGSDHANYNIKSHGYSLRCLPKIHKYDTM